MSSYHESRIDSAGPYTAKSRGPAPDVSTMRVEGNKFPCTYHSNAETSIGIRGSNFKSRTSNPASIRCGWCFLRIKIVAVTKEGQPGDNKWRFGPYRETLYSPLFVALTSLQDTSPPFNCGGCVILNLLLSSSIVSSFLRSRC